MVPRLPKNILVYNPELPAILLRTGRGVVFEVAFDSIHISKRHKSGLAMRFPRIHRIRKDKPADEADSISRLEAAVT
jgi:DNA ligase 1